MTIFNDSAYININNAAKNYQLSMLRTDARHMDPSDTTHKIFGADSIQIGQKIGIQKNSGASGFENIMLNALDKVSGAQQQASYMAREAIINPDSVDAHDVSIAQAEASMAFNITRNILNRLVQGWRDLINTR